MRTNLEEFYKKLGERIKFLRQQKGWTQEFLADKASISLNYLGKIEIAMNKPGLETILKLARVLGIDPHDLMKFD